MQQANLAENHRSNIANEFSKYADKFMGIGGFLYPHFDEVQGSWADGFHTVYDRLEQPWLGYERANALAAANAPRDFLNTFLPDEATDWFINSWNAVEDWLASLLS
nr:putative ORF1 [Marmot picobirnavirus]